MLTAKDVSRVLLHIWAPLNVYGYFKADDEYDDFAADLLPLLESGADEGAIEKALEQILAGLGLTSEYPGNTNRLTAVALVSLRSRRRS